MDEMKWNNDIFELYLLLNEQIMLRSLSKIINEYC